MHLFFLFKLWRRHKTKKTQKVGEEGKSPYFMENLGSWHIIIWPDFLSTKSNSLKFRRPQQQENDSSDLPREFISNPPPKTNKIRLIFQHMLQEFQGSFVNESSFGGIFLASMGIIWYIYHTWMLDFWYIGKFVVGQFLPFVIPSHHSRWSPSGAWHISGVGKCHLEGEIWSIDPSGFDQGKSNPSKQSYLLGTLKQAFLSKWMFGDVQPFFMVLIRSY